MVSRRKQQRIRKREEEDDVFIESNFHFTIK